jgi:hypothetical protein
MVLGGFGVKVFWDGPDLEVSEGDEVEIISGMKGEGHVRASVLRNRTSGATFKQQAEGASVAGVSENPEPPICGYARNVLVHTGGTFFTLEEKPPPIIPGIFRECSKFLDRRLVERCKDRDYHQVFANALSVLEDAIRVRLGVGPSYSGSKLINYAFNPVDGKLILGETEDERQSLYLVFEGLADFLRDPPKHHSAEESDERRIEAFEVVCMVDLLIRMIGKARLRDNG